MPSVASVSDMNSVVQIADLPLSSIMNEAVNSATGKVFSGEPIRKYTEKQFFKNYSNRKSTKGSLSPSKDSSICDKWNVVTTIFSPSEAVKRAVSVPGWCTVIVADTKTPEDYLQDLGLPSNIPQRNIRLLTLSDQKKLWGTSAVLQTFLKAIPYHHFSRKNIGYLYAIQHGAEFLFDFDDDNLLPLRIDGRHNNESTVLPPLTNTTHLQGAKVVQTNHAAFNHHPLMGASIGNSWARGFPLSLIQDKNTQGIIQLEHVTLDMNTIGVLQFCANGNPDIDAVHRLVHPLPIMFRNTMVGSDLSYSINDSISTDGTLVVPSNSFAPYNAQATIHTYNALWALLLPLTVPGRVSDIWRAYFAQAIFKDIELSLVILPPNILQQRNEHNYLADMQAELDLYFKSQRLVEFLSQWKSSVTNVPEKMEALWIDLYERGYIEIKDIKVVQHWLGALNEIGYKFPERKGP